MERNPNQPWLQLFRASSHGARATTVRFFLVERRGEPLLLLPDDRALIPPSLALYPAQTIKARMAKAAVGLSLRLGCPIGARRIQVPLDSTSEFVQFLDPAASLEHPPRFAVLLGNPRTAGRRFIVLPFGADDRPAKVVKAGTDPAAAELIRREKSFLQAAPIEQIHAPKLFDTFSSPEVEGVALEHLAGKLPRPDESTPLKPLLTSWIDNTKTMPFTALAAWTRLASAAKESPAFARLTQSLSAVPLHPAIHHGDFAPWNIRITPGTNDWRVLDWERGELCGPPAWDWFHYVVQPLLLVKRLPPGAIAERIEEMIAASEFSAYASAARIENMIRPLLLAYLLYCCDVVKPSEGLSETAALLEVLSDRWRTGPLA